MSLIRNTTYNLTGTLLPLTLALVTVPAYLNTIGEARYGILSIAWVLLGYFGVFDLGLGRATAQRIAALSDSPRQLRADSFWTALVLNCVLGGVGALLIWPVAHVVFASVELDPWLRSELLAALPWLSLALPVATATGVLGGALQGRQRFLGLNVVSVFGTALFQCLPLAVAMLWSPRLSVVMPAAIVARSATALPLYVLCRRELLESTRAHFNRKEARMLLGFGGWVTVSSFVGPLMVVLDRVLIGVLRGANAVSYYTVPFHLAERITLLPAAFSSALLPRLASANAAGRDLQSRTAFSVMMRLMTPAAAAAILALPSFLALWIGPEFSGRSALTGQLLVIGFWANSLARIPYTDLQARGRPDAVAKGHIAELIPYLGLLWLGLSLAGIEGAAVAFSARTIADLLLLSWFARILKSAALFTVLGVLALLAAMALAWSLEGSTVGLGLVLCVLLVFSLRELRVILKKVS